MLDLLVEFDALVAHDTNPAFARAAIVGRSIIRPQGGQFVSIPLDLSNSHYGQQTAVPTAA